VRDFLLETGIPRSRWSRELRFSPAFGVATDLRFDGEVQALTMDRTLAMNWIGSYESRRAAALRSPRDTAGRVQALYKTCRECGQLNHSRRRACAGCRAEDWK
jgi:hypothetical protein